MTPKSVRRTIRLTWERRIEHIDRPMRRCSQRFTAAALRKATHRQRRGLPSRCIPLALVFMRLDARRAANGSSPLSESETDALRRCYEKGLARSRLLEHKQVALAKVSLRRICVADTCINLWHRRQLWLSATEGARRNAVILQRPSPHSKADTATAAPNGL